MRNLTEHIVEGDSMNHQLSIEVLDEPGQGGACRRYLILGEDPTATGGPGKTEVFRELARVNFQDGPIREFGANGITHEALLAIVIDRLRSFQAGPYACRDNEVAQMHCEDALHLLQNRTRARIARGVEGTHQK